ncbi:EscR/YscR/HrcR family type III secretion system export apparatus protein [Robbsia sp. Bb-Pol-6]|uniref:EscR/YscR/HrcR family type III secretion system export apparatus protein n=1 Tax=Robbsia betulipollinis TaxID=2981849 RepID=A0ABT3ZL02_9BURK|nr:EscR/YscR/HrcR family type III secretion system export apparatus protein [Robbsia betulipollinis]MCY0387221.1 EscR/YscR/HrcR family type III secretion system export apparatus protein [Robbsia betulipollinis]
MHNPELSLISLIAIASLLPFVFASGTCFLKFSIVLVLLRNAIGVQQVPSNLVLNSIALMLAAFVMQPVLTSTFQVFEQTPQATSIDEASPYVTTVLTPYRRYLARYADADLVKFFENLSSPQKRPAILPGSAASPSGTVQQDTLPQGAAHRVLPPSLYALLPAYALSELRDAFRIGFYLYLPFIVVDLIVSNVLLALGMMMMSPVTISVPIKLILFVALDGWTLVAKDLVQPYLSLHSLG